LGSLSPNEKQADIARHPVGKVNNARRKMETLRLQIVAPSEKDFRGLATQRRWPIRVRRINGAAAIAAEAETISNIDLLRRPLRLASSNIAQEQSDASRLVILLSFLFNSP
jgi:hypothetical protein